MQRWFLTALADIHITPFIAASREAGSLLSGATSRMSRYNLFCVITITIEDDSVASLSRRNLLSLCASVFMVP